MAKRNSKNLSRVQSMLDGTYKTKIVVGDARVGRDDKQRKIGDRWTDSDGKEWEQKDGYIASVSKLPGVGIFGKVCKDCKTPCTKQRDKDTWVRMERCFYCQMHFEEDLKCMKIGKKGLRKWDFWVRLQQLNNMDAIEDEMIQWIEEQDKINKENPFDESIANAMSNANISMEIKNNK